MTQTTLASMTSDARKKRTRGEMFLDEMDQVVPWAELVAVIARYYGTSG